MKYLSASLATISAAFSIAPFMPLAGSVNTSSAPRALRTLRRSMLIEAGMVSINLYPRAAATKARPIPVLPDVGSTMVMPGLSLPLLSASQIMLAPIRHLTE
ncbi:hypothetical protein D3C81_1498860 [compost metagenome]